MHRVWNLLPPATPTAELRALVGGHPLIAQLLVQRGFDRADVVQGFLDPNHYTPSPPTALLGVEEAALLLLAAVEQKQNILVWGDFDVDGQTSTSLLVAGLRKLIDQKYLRFHVPNRFTESHGIKPDFLQPWLDDTSWQPHLLLTCDTGIAEAEAVAMAKARGITVVITDHHDLTPEFDGLAPGIDPLWGVDDETVPANSVRRADAIVNPKFQAADEPLRTLPGVGVAYKLIQQLYVFAGIAGEEQDLLDLVALGIVADVAEQVHDTRYLLQRGLDQLRQTERTGLLALMDVSRIAPDNVSADAIGFQIGPRMNALGRLEDATVSVELLTTRDPVRAGELAAKMERLNQQRRQITTQISAAAIEMIERNPKLLDYNGLVLTHPAWHAGIVGIVASRLVDTYQKPTVLLLNPPGEAARGSARSISGVDIGGSIAACSHLLLTHGGHPGAAGLSLLPENIDHFRRELDRQIELHRTDDGPQGLTIDADLPFSEIDMALAEELKRLAPYGNGNPTPQFISRNLRVVNDKRLGQEGTHRRLTLQQSTNGTPNGRPLPLIWFNGGHVELPAGLIDLVYTLEINEFRGERNVQLTYVDSRAATEDSATKDNAVDGKSVQSTDGAESNRKPERQIFDLRNQLEKREALPGRHQANWYTEGTLLNTSTKEPTSQAAFYAPRTEITAHKNAESALVLWSTPPSAALLETLLEAANPTTIYLCAQNTANDSITAILQETAGMVKHALRHDNILSIERAAARLGTTQQVVRLSVRWLAAKGLIAAQVYDDEDGISLIHGSKNEDSSAKEALQAEIESHLTEIRSYRRFFNRAPISELGIQ